MKKIGSIILYAIFGLLLGMYLFLEFIPNISMSEIGRLILLCGSSFFLYFGGVLLSKELKSKKPLVINLWIFFFLYISLFVTLTLFDPMWGRNGGFISWTKEILERYINHSMNLIPFHTIIGYIKGFDSMLSTRTIFFNLVGNFACLMPLGFFLPMLFSKQKNWKVFLITVFSFVVGIELIQFLTLSGSCDIDDVILNVLGAFTMYQVLKIPTLKNVIQNIFLLEKNPICKKSLFQIIGIFIMIVIVIGLLFFYREYRYQENYRKLFYQGSYTIDIIDETEMCAEALEPFYEDEFYRYSFPCIKSDSVYVLINDQKYLVKEILENNPTEYPITIDILGASGLKFIKESKYEMVKIEEKGNSYQIVIENQELLEVKTSDVKQDENEISLELYFIPKKSGKNECENRIF